MNNNKDAKSKKDNDKNSIEYKMNKTAKTTSVLYVVITFIFYTGIQILVTLSVGTAAAYSAVFTIFSILVLQSLEPINHMFLEKYRKECTDKEIFEVEHKSTIMAVKLYATYATVFIFGVEYVVLLFDYVK